MPPLGVGRCWTAPVSPCMANVTRWTPGGWPSWASPSGWREGLAAAEGAGAAGIQVGTLFAYARESGMDPALRSRVIGAIRRGGAEVRTDPRASSTGYPFKVVQLEGTVASPGVYAARPRVCDNGYLREP